jgi:RHS repeat-associated protein
VNYTYDNDSRLTQVTDPTGTYSFTFDNMGRLTNTTTSYAFLTGRNFTTAYSYDAASNRTGFTDPENGSTTYAYDTLNRLQTLTPPSAFTSGNFGFGYDALSRRTSLTRPNSVNTSYSYDNGCGLYLEPANTLSRLLSVLHQSGSTTLDGASYAVDNAGNRTSRTPQPSGTASNFTYDAIYELTQVTQGASTTESYSYDPVGNRLSSLGVSSYTNNSSNELTSTPSTTYSYDYNGNLVSKVDSTGTTQYFWDFENRLSSVTLPGSGGTVSFSYDPFGRRIKKVVSSTSTTSIFAYDGDNLVEETNASGTAVARYSQGLNIDEPLAMLRSGATSYYHADGLGSITSLSNGAGSLAQTYSFDSFGKLTNSSGSLTNPFRFTGREFDTETSLYYYRARYYDPQAGRFLGEDPIDFRGGMNFYLYVSNEPLDFHDPFGLKDNNQEETLQWLREAYGDATSGRIQGLRNIYNNSRGRWDLQYNPKYQNDTWTWCGKKMDAAQFGNFIAGFQGAAYDHYYFWTTGTIWAQAAVEVYGIKYHLRGATKAKHDPFDRTGRPDIRAGERVGWNFLENKGTCGCGGGGGW